MVLTSTGLKLALIALAVAAPLLAAWWWSRHGRIQTDQPRKRLLTAVGLVCTCVLAQVLAMGAAFVIVNDQYQFYLSVNDLLGKTDTGSGAIVVNKASGAAGGKIETITIHGKASHTTEQALVWLPPQYNQPAYRNHRFPLVEFLPGQPSYPGGEFGRFRMGEYAAAAIRSGVKPFVLVVSPIMIRPPLDTECTNVPNGPQALSWLTTDVPKAISSQLRVEPPGRHWSLIGWSTGAFCAAKLMLTKPKLYSAAVSMGGYYSAITKGTVPNLLGHSKTVREHNSPMWLYHNNGHTHGDRLLMISSKQDHSSWPQVQAMLKVGAGDTLLSYLGFAHGGHNNQVYASYLPKAIDWLAQGGAMG